MAKLLAYTILALLVGATAAGVVNHTRCGGVATFRELRIDGCEGFICYMTAGVPYACEGDLIPSTSEPSLTLKLTAIFLGMPVVILDVVLAQSSVQPGQLYVVKFTIVPNDILADHYLPVNAEIRHTDNNFIEICIGMHVFVCPDLSICGQMA